MRSRPVTARRARAAVASPWPSADHTVPGPPAGRECLISLVSAREGGGRAAAGRPGSMAGGLGGSVTPGPAEPRTHL